MSLSPTDPSGPHVVRPLGPPLPIPPFAGLGRPVGRLDGELALAAVDISAFGDPRRDNEIQLHLRRVLYDHLADAFDLTGLPWQACHTEDRGDGALIVAPPEVDPTHLLDPLAHHLTAFLRRSNKMASDTARLRLRMAVHAGRVHRDEHGLAGHSVIHLFRLLEAAAFKRALKTSGADFGLIVSDHLYADASARGGFFDPSVYRPMDLRCKETRTRGWLWLPAH